MKKFKSIRELKNKRVNDNILDIIKNYSGLVISLFSLVNIFIVIGILSANNIPFNVQPNEILFLSGVSIRIVLDMISLIGCGFIFWLIIINVKKIVKDRNHSPFSILTFVYFFVLCCYGAYDLYSVISYQYTIEKILPFFIITVLISGFNILLYSMKSEQWIKQMIVACGVVYIAMMCFLVSIVSDVFLRNKVIFFAGDYHTIKVDYNCFKENQEELLVNYPEAKKYYGLYPSDYVYFTNNYKVISYNNMKTVILSEDGSLDSTINLSGCKYFKLLPLPLNVYKTTIESADALRNQTNNELVPNILHRKYQNAKH